jgi:hypothetical protein
MPLEWLVLSEQVERRNFGTALGDIDRSADLINAFMRKVTVYTKSESYNGWKEVGLDRGLCFTALRSHVH